MVEPLVTTYVGALGRQSAHDVGRADGPAPDPHRRAGGCPPTPRRRSVGRAHRRGVEQHYIPDEPELADDITEVLETAKHLLWHGNAERALEELVELLFAVEELRQTSTAGRKLVEGLTEFETYMNNQDFIPNFGERFRQGETISTAFVESTINQVVSKRFVKKQQMQWILRGAHLLLQTRTRVINDELDDAFRRWYPHFREAA